MVARGQLPYAIEEFENQTSVFYENCGDVRIIGAQWQMVTYVPLENYDKRHDQLLNEINTMTNQCNEKITEYELCSKFNYILKTMFQEISVQREQMYESIGRYTTETEIKYNTKQKRGLVNIIGSAMKTLFGVCDDDCTKETTNQINEIEKTNDRMMHILSSQTTVVKTSVQGIDGAATEIKKYYTDLSDTQELLKNKIKILANNTHTIETLTLSNKVHNIFTALLSQFAFETSSLSAIITAARAGVIHSSLLTPRELSKHLTQIKLKLPINLNLPMGTNPGEIYELSKLTKMAVFYSGNQIVFLIRIPLITELELTLYKILPIPHQITTRKNGTIDNKHSIILKPEYQYVGITKNRRQYTTFTETQLLHCTETDLFTICPEFQPIQYESKNQPCEVSLFKNPDRLPQTCEAGVIVLTKNIFHKLKYANTWIFTTNNETLTIACQKIKDPFIVKLRKQGLIRLNQDCRAYAENIILNPTRDMKSRYYVNFIPKIGVGKLSQHIPNTIGDLNFPNKKFKHDSHKLDDVHQIAHSLDEVQDMINTEIRRQSGYEIDTDSHSYLIYIILGLLVISIILLYIYMMYKYKYNTWSQVAQSLQGPSVVEQTSRKRCHVETTIPVNKYKVKTQPFGDTPDRKAIDNQPPMIKI